MWLTIRETTAHDLPELGRLWNDGRVMQWVGFPDGLGYDEEALRAWLRRIRSSRHEHHFVMRESDLGFCGELFYRVDTEHRRAELDVKLVPEAQGRGIATVGLSRLIELVFEREPCVEAVGPSLRRKPSIARPLRPLRNRRSTPAERPSAGAVLLGEATFDVRHRRVDRVNAPSSLPTVRRHS